MIVVGILFVCKRNAQTYFNNQLLLAKGEDLRKNDLRKAEQLHKELRRDFCLFGISKIDASNPLSRRGKKYIFHPL